jgi:hypothetical protein
MTVLRQEPGLGESLSDLLGLQQLRPVSLKDVVENAALMHRVDRKYLVSLDTARSLLAELADSHAVLQIAGRRSTSYRSTYFDTPAYSSSRSHVQGRRRRWKVRSRLYVEDQLCRIEVKTKNGRGATIKTVAPSTPGRYARLAGSEHEFVQNVLATPHPEVDVNALIPTAEVTYARVSLADVDAGTRVTFDWNLSATLHGGDAWIDENYLLIETKGGPVPARADRVLTGLRAFPRSFSKYVAATSLVRPDIADNDLRHLRGTSLHCRIHPSSSNGRP